MQKEHRKIKNTVIRQPQGHHPLKPIFQHYFRKLAFSAQKTTVIKVLCRGDVNKICCSNTQVNR